MNTDVELAVFEADHGSPARAVALARRALGGGAERALRRRARLGADPGGPAREGLRWAHRALRLGSRDPLFLYHAGMAARGRGRTGEARHAAARARSR